MAGTIVTIDRLCLALGGAAAALALAPAAAWSPWMIGAAVLGVVACIAWTDGSSFTIPDGAVVALALVGVASRVVAEGASAATGVGLMLDVALTGGVLWLLREGFYRFRGHDGLGLGDVKLAAAGGCLVGAPAFATALLGASVLGLVVALAAGGGDRRRIAFGALLAPAIWTVWVAGPLI